MSSPEGSLLRLRVVADADPGVLARFLERFQNINFIPRRVVAEFATNGKLHVEIDTFGITEAHLTLIAAKIGEATSVVSSYWHRV